MRKLKYTLIITLLLLSSFLKAQNTGPVAPEAMSFEPVDAQGMVNLNSGDLAYVLPILNVPSPEGGYSMALSYHSGIGVDAEASWVGLGWSLTPGALSRNVSEIPDDMKYGIWTYRLSKDLGNYEFRHFSLTVPLEAITVGISATWGDYNTVGASVGFAGAGYVGLQVGDVSQVSAGIGFGPNNGVNVGVYAGDNGVGINLGLGVGPESGNGLSGGVGLSIGTNGVGINAGVSHSFYGGGFNGSYSLASVGISFSSSGTSISGRSVGAYSSNGVKVNNKNVSYNAKNSGIDLGLLSFGRSRTDMYLYKEEEKTKYGIMYISEAIEAANSRGELHDLQHHDYYGVQTKLNITDVLSVSNGYKNEIETPQNFVLPAYDKYSISGQGIGGSISPMLFNYYDGDVSKVAPLNIPGNYNLISYHDNDQPNKWYDLIHKEIVNYYQGTDFSSISPETSKIRYFTEYSTIGHLEASEGEFIYDNSHGNTTNPYDGLWGNFSYVGGALTDGTNPKTSDENHDINYIEWFTNEEIANNLTEAKNRGFIETESIKNSEDNEFSHPRLDVRYFDPTGIGAYTVTALDGKKYHYSLPVYQFEQVLYKFENGDAVYESWDLGKYASNWLLTAITGPDYIDRTGDGLSDDDYGYWVKFEYSKWTDSYIWCFPYEIPDDYNETQLNGRKQIYYLDAIRTRTHTALFLKDLREDGLGSYGDAENLYLNTVNNMKADACLKLLPEEFKDVDGNLHTKTEISNWLESSINGETIVRKSCDYKPKFSKYILNDTKVLKLSKIILLENKYCPDIDKLMSTLLDEPQEIISSDRYDFEKEGDQGTVRTYSSIIYSSSIVKGYHKILNINALNEHPELITHGVKVIDFETDYSLCNGAENSSSGKLTLNSINIKGVGGKKCIPSYNFSYAFNPSHNRDNNMDDWGYYITNSEKCSNKLDNQDAVNKQSEDAWSLTKITTPIGTKMNIEYEPDTYWREAATNYGVYAEIESITFPCVDMYTINIDFKSAASTNNFIIGNYYHFNDFDFIRLKAINRIDANTVQFLSCPILDFVAIPAKDLSVFISAIEADLTYYNVRADKCGISATVAPGVPLRFDVLNENILKDDYKFLTMEQTNDFTFYGGGVRTKSIRLVDEVDNEYKTTYNYNDPTTGLTSGITSYAPGNSDVRYIPYKNLLPGPSVMYKYCTVTRYDSKDNNGTSKRYQYEVLDPVNNPLSDDISLGSLLRVNVHEGGKYGSTILRNAKIEDNLSRLGNIITQTSFNESGDVIQKAIYRYMSPSEYPYGTRQETYSNVKAFWDWAGGHTSVDENAFYLTSITKAQYPSVLKEIVTESQYKKQTRTFSKLDENTGVFLETTTTDNTTGDEYSSINLPAYYVYEEMGSKLDEQNNKNMLTQTAASFTKKNGRFINIGIQTWNDSWKYRNYNGNNYVDATEEGVWRKHKQFVWKGDMNSDGTYGANFSTYDKPEKLAANWDDLETETDKWQQVNEITRYNHYSAPLESKDINGHYASAKMDINSEKTIATAANASYRQFTYSGFENQKKGDYVEGEVKLKSTYSVIDNSYSHTGDYSLRTYGLSNSFEYKVEGLENGYTKPYKISLWALTNSVQAIGLDVEVKFYNSSNSVLYTDNHTLSSYQKEGFGEWYLFDIITPVPDQIPNAGQIKKLVISVDNGLSKEYIYIDDFRVHPVDAPMQSYVYDHHTGAVTAILDNNNIATKYEYDDAGKLKTVLKEVPGVGAEGGFKKVSEHNYGYARPLENGIEFVDASATTSTLANTAERRVTLRVEVKNNDLVDQTCNISCTLAGEETQDISRTVSSNGTQILSCSWTLPSGSATTRKITIRGDVEDEFNVSIPGSSVSNLIFKSYTVAEQTNGVVKSTVTYQNTGGTAGTASLDEYVYVSENAGVWDYDGSNWDQVKHNSLVVWVEAGKTASSYSNFSLENGYYAFILKDGSAIIDEEYVHVTSYTPPPSPTLTLMYLHSDTSPYQVTATLSNISDPSGVTVELKYKDLPTMGTSINPSSIVLNSGGSATFTVTVGVSDFEVFATASGGSIGGTLTSNSITLPGDTGGL